MSYQSNYWLSCPDGQALLDRARRYHREVYAGTGDPPDRFLVTEYEYDRLKMFPGTDEIYIMDMRICRPERMDWYRDNLYMEHFKMSAMSSRPIQQWDPLPCAPERLERCRTERPPTRQPDVTCPCGEVVWELSMCQWDDVRSTFLGIPLVVDPTLAPGTWMIVARHEPSAASGNPLPPLDDLDEGLQCCGHTYPTFAKFMMHRRQHGEG